MSILIKGMEMPGHGDMLVVRQINGRTYIKHDGHIGFEGMLKPVEDGWIPTSEQLPPEKQNVILSGTDWTGEGCLWEKGSSHGQGGGLTWKVYRYNRTFGADEVVSWKPMPEPCGEADDEP